MLSQASRPFFLKRVEAALPVRAKWGEFFMDVGEYEARGFVYVCANLPPVQRTYDDIVMILATIDYKNSSLNNGLIPI